MRKEGVSYQDMFRKIKSTMVTQRKIIRASGRESHDNMKLSRDKITDLSHNLASMLRKQRETRGGSPCGTISTRGRWPRKGRRSGKRARLQARRVVVCRWCM
jgi:hypothetical protein